MHYVYVTHYVSAVANLPVVCAALCLNCVPLQEVELDGMEGQRDWELVRQVLSYEQDRVRFLLKAYLRARLEKIEQFAGESSS
jgi:hypothetical protein